jgi:acyl carrier protein
LGLADRRIHAVHARHRVGAKVTKEEILQSLTEVFREVFDDNTLVLQDETNADDIEAWDSYMHINIVVATEMRFGIKFQTSEIEALRNVGEFIELISRKLG